MAENQESMQSDSRSYQSELIGNRFPQAYNRQRDRVVARGFIELLRVVSGHALRGRQGDPSDDEPAPIALSSEPKKRMQDSILKASALKRQS